MGKTNNNTNSAEEKMAREDIELFLGWKISMPKLIQLLNETINELHLEHVKPITYKGGWERRFDGSLGKIKGDILWWKEFLLVTTEVKRKIKALGTDKEQTLYEILKNRSPRINDRILYGYFINQDTMLPKFFESSYQQKLPNIKFIPFEDWSEGLEAFASDKIHVALRDFGTTVAYNSLLNLDSPLFFWPFLTFEGYYIIVNSSAIKTQFGKDSFKELKPAERKAFLEEQNSIVEKNTDFEWVLKKFCEHNLCDMKVIQNKITYMNTRQAKTEFASGSNYGLYSTNPAHAIDLSRKEGFELLPQRTIVNHKNVNGLMCKEDYYKKNKEVIQRLIKPWFDNIMPFKTEIDILALPISHRPENYSPSYTVKNLLNELNELTQSQLNIDDLPLLYEKSNVFYDEASHAFDEFYNKILTDPMIVNNYCKIAQIQLGRDDTDTTQLRKVIDAIKNNMIKR